VLGPTEFRLLHYLMTHAERVHSRVQLLDQVWGDHVFVEERTVDVHIRRLRLALLPTTFLAALSLTRLPGDNGPLKSRRPILCPQGSDRTMFASEGLALEARSSLRRRGKTTW
jgi:hypothetical protein